MQCITVFTLLKDTFFLGLGNGFSLRNMVYLYPILLNLPLLPLKCSRYYLVFPTIPSRVLSRAIPFLLVGNRCTFLRVQITINTVSILMVEVVNLVKWGRDKSYYL